MSRKIILNLAMSLDGFIADEKGLYDWIKGDGSPALNTHVKWDYARFLETVDLVVMGRKCYDQGMSADFNSKQVIVATSQNRLDIGNVKFFGGDICGLIRQEREKEGQDIYLFGGGVLAEPFVRADLIDEYIIGIIPIILGGGRQLFFGGHSAIPLKLQEYIVEEGVVILRYQRRTNP